jgi:hypothetical protein
VKDAESNCHADSMAIGTLPAPTAIVPFQPIGRAASSTLPASIFIDRSAGFGWPPIAAQRAALTP